MQLAMLDAVDARQSLLVVAPTSSGKTFVSYYTMHHVLAANRGRKARTPPQRVVFVMPTKALIIQTQGDLYNRYKEFITNSSETVFASWSRDFRDPGHLAAQILITVPELLEAMLLSPLREHRAWVATLKCVTCLDTLMQCYVLRAQVEAQAAWLSFQLMLAMLVSSLQAACTAVQNSVSIAPKQEVQQAVSHNGGCYSNCE